ncbi:aminoglycoside phosphotransferase family protein [Nocardia sp. NPDC047038]|uniref:aminoglycoside phosphotransferase family protein n=1 Tax=Nocardia sp. NPDC047038 TaxID=3154338 RepID=UPI0033D1923A
MTTLDPSRARQLREVLASACARAGLGGADDAELIKYTNNATYRLAGAVIARVGIGALGRTRAPRVVTMARWLAERDAPTVRLLDAEQPVYIGDYAVTFWHEVPSTAVHGWDFTAGELAAAVKSLHTIPVADAASLPTWDAFTAASLRVHAADPMIDAESLDWLRTQWTQVQREYRNLTMPRRGVIHGDAHTGNLLRTPADTTILADLDSAGIGPIGWDLAVVAVDGIRFGRSEFYSDFAAAYGADVTSWTEWPVLRRIRELLLVTSAIPDLSRRPDTATEHAHRLRTLRAGQLDAIWRPYK